MKLLKEGLGTLALIALVLFDKKTRRFLWPQH